MDTLLKDESGTEITCQPEQEKSPNLSKPERKKLVELPLARVKQIIKVDPDVSLVSSEAIFMIAKCAELFIGTLTKEAYVFTSSGKKKTVQKRDIDSAIDNIKELCFLEGALE